MLGEFARRARQLKKAHAFGVDALRHVETARSPLARARVHRFLAGVHQDLGRGEYAVEHRRSAVDELRRVGDRRSTAELLLELAEPDSSSAAEARAWLHEADQLANQVGWREGVSRSRARLEKLK